MPRAREGALWTRAPAWLVAPTAACRTHCPEDASRCTICPLWCMGRGKKLCSDLTPTTTGAREAGICGIAHVADVRFALDGEIVNLGVEGALDLAAVPPKRMDMRSR